MAALNIWGEKSGYSFGIFQERSTLEGNGLPLPLISNSPNASFTIISGKLPGGLRIDNKHIIGTPYEVSSETTYEFCIRASLDITDAHGKFLRTDIADRTFTITITGADAPEFVTPAGPLSIGGGGTQYFVLDSSYVEYQIAAYDRDTAAGQRLSYYIASEDGELPPGLDLSEDGVISGLVAPALSIKPEDGDGSYDAGYYDSVAYDFGARPSNGYDSYMYDTVFFDFSLPASRPKKLNRNYEFIVSITDGNTVAKRKFSIFVVGDDYFRADNLNMFDSTGLFTADSTYLRAPIWLTKSNLGLYRANNYVTLILDTYDTNNVIYNLERINSDVYAKTHKKLYTDNTALGYSLTISSASSMPAIGQWLTFDGLFSITNPTTGEVTSPTSLMYQITDVLQIGTGSYRLTLSHQLEVNIPEDLTIYIGDLSELPPGMQFDPNTSEVFGIVPYQPAITKSYKFTVTASRFSDNGEYARAPRIFKLSIIGEVDSVISWISPSDLGSINANYISTLKLSASTSVDGSTLLYTVTDGRLPPGLSLALDGEIIGKTNQFAKVDIQDNILKAGLTTFDYNSGSITTFDNGATTIDRVFSFTVRAEDQFGYSASEKTFTITVETPNDIIYGNLRTKPFLKLSQRATWKNFITDGSIFTPDSIYRLNDANFGVQEELSMLVYAGIESAEAAAYISAMGLNNKRKRFQFGEVKKAVAVIPGTTDQVYEVVYIQMVDPLEPSGSHLPLELNPLSPNPNKLKTDLSNRYWQPGFHKDDPLTADELLKQENMESDYPGTQRPDPFVTVDSQGYRISNYNATNYFPSSISNWRQRLKDSFKIDQHGNKIPLEKERNYLPLWMRSIQPGSKQELDFQLAVPLCYCKVGSADDIILNIKHSGFDFKQLDFTADRYIIDSLPGEEGDKYLVFKNDRITV